MPIKRADLVDVLVNTAYKAKIPIYFGKRLVAIDDDDKTKQNEITLTFSDGTTDSADFLLGCDGIHSRPPRLFVDPDRTPHYTGMRALSRSSRQLAYSLTPRTSSLVLTYRSQKKEWLA